MTSTDLSAVLPELILAVFAMAALMYGAYGGGDKTAKTILWATAAVMAGLAAWIGLNGAGSNVAFGGMFIDDAFSRFSKVTLLLAGAAILLMSESFMSKNGLLRFEYPILLALASVGMMMMVSAGDLMSLYMGLELQSLSLYVVASLRRDSVKSTEAGLKYFVLGALSSGLLLYGASLVYGYAGTTLFSGIIQTASAGDVSLGLLFGLVFMITGLAFKVSAVPFHMWTPDVYEGSPTPVTAFFATAPKVAAMAMFARVMFDAFGLGPDHCAVIRRLNVPWCHRRYRPAQYQTADGLQLDFPYGVCPDGGVQAMLIYMAIYVTMNVGTFAFILSMERDGRAVTDIGALNMLSKKEPLKALAMLVLLFSLAGVPPLVGFFGKFYVLKAAVDANLAWLAVAGVIASVIGAFYYLRIIYYMYFGEDGDSIDGQMAPVQWLFLMGAALIMVVGVVNLFGIEALAATAAAALVN